MSCKTPNDKSNETLRRRRNTWSEEDMKQAIKAIHEKTMGLKKAAKHYNVPMTSLRRLALELTNSPTGSSVAIKKKIGRRTVLPAALEEELVQHILLAEKQLTELTPAEVKSLAYQLAVKHSIPNPFLNERAGRKWLDLFLRRHKNRLSKKKLNKT